MKKSARLSNIYITILFVSTIALVFTSCKSPTDISTGLGRSIVEEYDSRLTNPAENFKLFHDSLPIVSAQTQSLINLDSGKAAGLHISNEQVVCGVYRDQQSIAYMEFNATTFSVAVKKYRDNLSFRRIKLRLKAIDSTLIGPSVYSIFKTTLKNHYALQSTPLTTDTPLDTSTISLPGNGYLTFNFPDSLITTNDTSIHTINFALNGDLVPRKHFARFFNNSNDTNQPTIFIEYRATAQNDTSKDSIRTEAFGRSYTDYSVREINAVPVANSMLISSQNTDRYIRFAVTASALWDTLQTNSERFATIMDASFIISFDSIIVEPADTNALKDTIGQLWYGLSNVLTDSASTYVKQWHSINFSTKKTDVKLPVIDNLQSMAETSRNDQVYLYIHLKSMSSGPYGTLYLTKPSKLLFHAIASNPVPSN